MTLGTELALGHVPSVGIRNRPRTRHQPVILQQLYIEVPAAGSWRAGCVGPMAGQAHDASPGDRTRRRGRGGLVVFERDGGQVGVDGKAPVGIAGSVVPVVPTCMIVPEDLIAGMLEGVAGALIMVEAVAVGAPRRHALDVGGMRFVRLYGLGIRDIETAGCRCGINEIKKTILDRTGTVEHAEAATSMWIVATGATQLTGGVGTPGTVAPAVVWSQTVVGGNDAMSGSLSPDGIGQAVGAVIDIFFEQKDEISGSFFRGRIQGTMAEYPMLSAVAHQADIRGAGRTQKRLGTLDHYRAVFAVVHDVAAVTCGNAPFVKRQRGHGADRQPTENHSSRC